MTKKQTTEETPKKSSHFFRNFFIIVFGVIGALIFNLARKVGGLTTLYSFPENPQCTYHERRLVGPEDMTKIRENVFIASSNDNIQMWEMAGFKETPKGQIFVYYLDTQISQVLKLENYPEEINFFPHGIFFDHNTEKLHVLNHPYQGKGDRIEVFQLNTKDINNIQMEFVESLQMPEYLNGNANDILFIGNNEYIVTQWIFKPDGLTESRRNTPVDKLTPLLNAALNRKVNPVHSCVHDENKKMNCVIIQGTTGEMNNGITWDLKDQVFVSDTFAKKVAVYKLNLNTTDRTQRLEFQQFIDTNCHPDNVEYDRYKNQILVAGVGKAYQFDDFIGQQIQTHPEYADKVEGLWVVVDRINIEGNNQYKLENILTRDDSYRGLSVALEYKNQIVIGSFMDKSIATCNLNGVNPRQPYTHTILSLIQSLVSKIIPI